MSQDRLSSFPNNEQIAPFYGRDSSGLAENQTVWLASSNGARLRKMAYPDGTRAYEHAARTLRVEPRRIAGLDDALALIAEIHDRDACFIPGRPDVEVGVPFERQAVGYRDYARQFLVLDVDKHHLGDVDYSILHQPGRAIAQALAEILPDVGPFDFVWIWSASQVNDGKVSARVVAMLDRPLTLAEQKGWLRNRAGLDVSIMHTSQLVFTARPILKAPAVQLPNGEWTHDPLLHLDPTLDVFGIHRVGSPVMVTPTEIVPDISVNARDRRSYDDDSVNRMLGILMAERNIERFGAFLDLPKWRADGDSFWAVATYRPSKSGKSVREGSLKISPKYGVRDFGAGESMSVAQLVARLKTDGDEGAAIDLLRAEFAEIDLLFSLQPPDWDSEEVAPPAVESAQADDAEAENAPVDSAGAWPMEGHEKDAIAAYDALKRPESWRRMGTPRGLVSVDYARENGREFLVNAATHGADYAEACKKVLEGLIASHKTLVARRVQFLNAIGDYLAKCPTREEVDRQIREAEAVEFRSEGWENANHTNVAYLRRLKLKMVGDLHISTGSVPVGRVEGDTRTEEEIVESVKNVIMAGSLRSRIARLRAMIDDLAGKYILFVCGGYTGTGKTTVMVKDIAAELGKKVFMVVPTTRLAYKVEENLLSAGVSAGILPGYSAKVTEEMEAEHRTKGRPYPERGCRRYGEGVAIYKAGGQWERICRSKEGECPYIETCPIQVMRNKIKNGVDSVVMVHSMLAQAPSELLPESDVLFFDEARHASFRGNAVKLTISNINSDFIRVRFDVKDEDGKTVEQLELEGELTRLTHEREATAGKTKRIDSKIAKVQAALDRLPKRQERFFSDKAKARKALEELSRIARSTRSGGLSRDEIIETRTKHAGPMRALLEQINSELKTRHGELEDSPERNYPYKTETLRALRVLTDMVMNMTPGAERAGRIIRDGGDLVLRPVSRIDSRFVEGKAVIYSNATLEPDDYIEDAFTVMRRIRLAKCASEHEDKAETDTTPAVKKGRAVVHEYDKTIPIVPQMVKSDSMTVATGKNVSVTVYTDSPVTGAALGLGTMSSTFEVTSLAELRRLAEVKAAAEAELAGLGLTKAGAKAWKRKTMLAREAELVNRLLLATHIQDRAADGKQVLVVAGGRLRSWLELYFEKEAAGGMPPGLKLLPRGEAVGRDDFKAYDHVIVLGAYLRPPEEAHAVACAIDDAWSDHVPGEWPSHPVLEWEAWALMLQALERARTVVDHEKPMNVEVFIGGPSIALPIPFSIEQSNVVLSANRKRVLGAEHAGNLDVQSVGQSCPIRPQTLLISIESDWPTHCEVPSECGAWLLSRRGLTASGALSKRTAEAAVAYIKANGLPAGFKAFTADLRAADGSRREVKAQTFVVANGFDPCIAISELTGLLVVSATQVVLGDKVVEADEDVSRVEMEQFSAKAARLAREVLDGGPVVMSKDGVLKFHGNVVPERFASDVLTALKADKSLYRVRAVVDGEKVSFAMRGDPSSFTEFKEKQVTEVRVTRKPALA